MKQKRALSPLAQSAALWLVVLLILFPKGGARLAGVPLTWGYMLLGALAVPALAVRLLVLPLRFPRRVLFVISLLLPMQYLFFYAGRYYGIANPPFTVSTFTGLFILPWIFLLIYGPFFRRLDGDQIARWFCGCVFLAAAWGIFLFFLHPLTGHFIEIPYLTVNASDYGELENTKNILRGRFFKLISTYNNGNLYGVSTLLLFPLYLQLETSRFRRNTVRTALFLTLSRTVWAGLILNEVLSLVLTLSRQVVTFPVLYLGAARRRFIAVMAAVGFAVGSALFTNVQGGLQRFLLDATGGERIDQVYAAQGTSFLPEHALYGFQEVLYASAAQYWGITGLIAFTLIMFSPLLVLIGRPQLVNSPLQRAALKGLVIYIVMAAVDGALDFIPVMAFYWFVYAVYLYGWPGTQRERAPAAVDVGSPTPAAGLATLPAGA